MNSGSKTRFSVRRNQRVVMRWFRIVLLIVALVSSPFQFSLASCSCPQDRCCSQIDACQCCEATTACCCAISDEAENADEAENETGSSCSSCGCECQCGTLEVTPNDHQICQTEVVDASLLPPQRSAFFSGHSPPIVAASRVCFPDLVSLRLHAFLSVWVN